MHVVLVHIHVKPEAVDPFKEACLDNARNSLLEPGVARFDVLQEKEDPTRFTLVEVYQTADDQLLHRETDHYNRWKNRVEGMMAEPRVGVKYASIFPGPEGWRS